MPKKSRKYYTPEEKIALLRKHLVEKVAVSQICEEQGLQVSLFYAWLRQFFEKGAVVFQHTDRQQDRLAAAKDREIATLKQKLQNKNEVVAELMEEHVQLKKELGDL
jgi:transposase-like protein